ISSEQLVPLGINAPERSQLWIRVTRTTDDSTVDDRQIDRAILVKIGEAGAETSAAPACFEQLGGRRSVFERSAWSLHPESVGLPRQMGHQDIQQAIAVYIA